VTVRSSAWFGAKCRLVYFIIDFYRQAQGRAFGGDGFFFLSPPNNN
jgi:hypothetical protein